MKHRPPPFVVPLRCPSRTPRLDAAVRGASAFTSFVDLLVDQHRTGYRPTLRADLEARLLRVAWALELAHKDHPHLLPVVYFQSSDGALHSSLGHPRAALLRARTEAGRGPIGHRRAARQRVRELEAALANATPVVH